MCIVGVRQCGLLCLQLRTNKSFDNKRSQIGDCMVVWGTELVGVVGWKGGQQMQERAYDCSENSGFLKQRLKLE